MELPEPVVSHPIMPRGHSTLELRQVQSDILATTFAKYSSARIESAMGDEVDVTIINLQPSWKLYIYVSLHFEPVEGTHIPFQEQTSTPGESLPRHV